MTSTHLSIFTHATHIQRFIELVVFNLNNIYCSLKDQKSCLIFSFIIGRHLHFIGEKVS